MRKPRVKYRQGKDGQWRWRLVAGNGEILCAGESHSTKSDVLAAIQTTRQRMAEAGHPELEEEDAE